MYLAVIRTGDNTLQSPAGREFRGTRMRIKKIRLENIGGFRKTELDFTDSRVVIGSNNSGKTTLLRVIDWVFNDAVGFQAGANRALDDFEASLLVPARGTRNQARRILIDIEDIDGRSHKKFEAKSGIATLRIQFRGSHCYVQINNQAVRGEKPRSLKAAIELLGKLQDNSSVIYIPAARDARSDLFVNAATALLEQGLVNQLAKAEVRPKDKSKARQFSKQFSELHKLAETSAQDVSEEIKKSVQAINLPTAQFSFPAKENELIKFLAQGAKLSFSFGDHDEDGVKFDQIGSGMQSLLGLSMMGLSAAHKDNRLLLVEEPELFLHPSAQVELASSLFSKPPINSKSQTVRTIVSTHSPVILAESRLEGVVVIRDHQIFEPVSRSELQNAGIIADLETGISMFGRSILLVEGIGDRAFFEALRRRLAREQILDISVVSRMALVAVGANTSFTNHVNLYKSYRDSIFHRSAYDFLVCADSLDSVPPVLKAMNRADIVVPQEMRRALDLVTEEINKKNNSSQTIAQVTTAANTIADRLSLPIHFTPLDLEYSMLAGASSQTLREIAKSMSLKTPDQVSREEILGRLGSKAPGATKIARPDKAFAVRAKIGALIPFSELTSDTRNLIWRWAEPIASEMNLVRPDSLK